MSSSPATGELVRTSWHRFLDDYEPLRPDLYRYCRHLTRSPWDAEDIVQDTLARAFVTLATLREPPANPRAWLFRVASNLWINHVKHVRDRPGHASSLEPATATPDPRVTREAAGTLLSELTSQERCAVVLKDVFALSLVDIAEVLATTPNAIKAALHRGRGKLVDPAGDHEPVTPAVLDAFCAAFNARDLDRLTSLMIDSSTVELPGLVIELGPEAAKAGTFRGTLFGCPDVEHAQLPAIRAEVRGHRGESIMLWWHDGAVHTIVRAVIAEAPVPEGHPQIARLVSYYHAPEVVEEVCRELGVPFQTHGHRYWPAESHGGAA